mmetsp:Transcript_138635/g.276460  ORF Transcript_138635/g.276460 Transcript_138635/m.276460 type:complete len:122 (+) Transcript_138635:374-739(+)
MPRPWPRLAVVSELCLWRLPLTLLPQRRKDEQCRRRRDHWLAGSAEGWTSKRWRPSMCISRSNHSGRDCNSSRTGLVPQQPRQVREQQGPLAAEVALVAAAAPVQAALGAVVAQEAPPLVL